LQSTCSGKVSGWCHDTLRCVSSIWRRTSPEDQDSSGTKINSATSQNHSHSIISWRLRLLIHRPNISRRSGHTVRNTVRLFRLPPIDRDRNRMESLVREDEAATSCS
jgi:hypothetical protein